MSSAHENPMQSSFELNLFVAFSLFFSFIYFCSCKWQTVHDLLFYCSNAVDKWLQGITWGSLFIFACQIQPRDFFRIVCHAFNEYCTSTTWSINLINDSSDFVSFSPEWFWSQCIWFDSGSLCVGLTSIWSLRLEICSVLASQMRADSFLGSRMEKCRHFYHWCRENQARRGMRKARASERWGKEGIKSKSENIHSAEHFSHLRISAICFFGLSRN